jgi:hypothetical protein
VGVFWFTILVHNVIAKLPPLDMVRVVVEFVHGLVAKKKKAASRVNT